VLKDVTGVDLPPPARKTIDLEGRVVKDGVRTALRDRQEALSELIEAIRKYRKLAEKTPLTLQGSDFAQAVEELNRAIDRKRHA
jgi:predicted RecB family endonuclease